MAIFRVASEQLRAMGGLNPRALNRNLERFYNVVGKSNFYTPIRVR